MNRIEEYEPHEMSHSPEALAENVEDSRKNLDSSVDHLKDTRVYKSAQGAVDWAKGKLDEADASAIKDVSSEAWTSVSRTVKEHPLPFIFGGLAVAASFLPKRSDKEQPTAITPAQPLTSASFDQDRVVVRTENGSTEYGDDKPSAVKQKLGDAQEAVSETYASTKEKLSDVTNTVGEKMATAATSTRESASRIQNTVSSKVESATTRTSQKLHQSKEDYPLCMALGTIAVGLLAGLAIPLTRKEGELMGSKAQSFRSEVKNRANSLKADAKAKLEEENLTAEGISDRVNSAIESRSEDIQGSIEENA